MEKKSDKKILLTGGHAAIFAYATIEELLARSTTKNWKIAWVGAKGAFEGKKAPTIESKVFPSLGVKQYFLTTGRVQRKFTLWTIPSLLKIPVGFVHAFFLIRKVKPDVIVSFGGFVAPPVVFAGWLNRIPIIVHEQTLVAGRANAFSAKFATKVALSRNELTKEFPPEKTVVVGNPIRSSIRSIAAKKKMGNPPLIYITGGSRGSSIINETVGEALPELLKNYKIIHQTGDLEYQKYVSLKKTLDPKLSSRYGVRSTIPDVEKVFSQADILVGRSGANTVAEAILTHRPSLFIPLRIARKDEQYKNAQMAQENGIARVVREEDLTSEHLISEIDSISKSWEKMVRSSASKHYIDHDAHKVFVDLIERVVS